MLARFLITLVRAYQLTISPWLGRVCRFEPSCSRYTVACLEAHGAMRGGLLSVKRLCKCHPFHPGGFDPPPSARPRTLGRVNHTTQTPDGRLEEHACSARVTERS